MELRYKGLDCEMDLEVSEVESTPETLIGLRLIMAGVDDSHGDDERDEHLLPANRNILLSVSDNFRFLRKGGNDNGVEGERKWGFFFFFFSIKWEKNIDKTLNNG